MTFKAYVLIFTYNHIFFQKILRKVFRISLKQIFTFFTINCGKYLNNKSNFLIIKNELSYFRNIKIVENIFVFPPLYIYSNGYKSDCFYCFILTSMQPRLWKV